MPAYVLFSDATLRDMARIRPGSAAALLNVRGVGERKLADLGQQFVEHIANYCRAQNIAMDVIIGSLPRRERIRKPTDTKETAFELFTKGASVEQVTAITGRAPSTSWSYLAEFVQTHRPERLDAWIGPKTYRAIAAAVDKHGTAYLRPIFEDVDGKISYDQIRVVVAHLNATRN